MNVKSVTLSTGIHIYGNFANLSYLTFERREILLIVGVIFIMIGSMAILQRTDIPIIISISVYFGIKSFVKWRKKQIRKALGEGMCVSCGAKIVENKCPVCDATKEV